MWGFDPFKDWKWHRGKIYYYEACFAPTDAPLVEWEVQFIAHLEVEETGTIHNQIIISFPEEFEFINQDEIRAIDFNDPMLGRRALNCLIPVGQQGKIKTLRPWELFIALKSYVAGIAEIGVLNILQDMVRDNAGSEQSAPFGFNFSMIRQFLSILHSINYEVYRDFVIAWWKPLVETIPVEDLHARLQEYTQILHTDFVGILHYASEKAWIATQGQKLTALQPSGWILDNILYYALSETDLKTFAERHLLDHPYFEEHFYMGKHPAVIAINPRALNITTPLLRCDNSKPGLEYLPKEPLYVDPSAIVFFIENTRNDIAPLINQLTGEGYTFVSRNFTGNKALFVKRFSSIIARKISKLARSFPGEGIRLNPRNRTAKAKLITETVAEGLNNEGFLEILACVILNLFSAGEYPLSPARIITIREKVWGGPWDAALQLQRIFTLSVLQGMARGIFPAGSEVLSEKSEITHRLIDKNIFLRPNYREWAESFEWNEFLPSRILFPPENATEGEAMEWDFEQRGYINEDGEEHVPDEYYLEGPWDSYPIFREPDSNSLEGALYHLDILRILSFAVADHEPQKIFDIAFENMQKKHWKDYNVLAFLHDVKSVLFLKPDQKWEIEQYWTGITVDYLTNRVKQVIGDIIPPEINEVIKNIADYVKPSK